MDEKFFKYKERIFVKDDRWKERLISGCLGLDLDRHAHRLFYLYDQRNDHPAKENITKLPSVTCYTRPQFCLFCAGDALNRDIEEILFAHDLGLGSTIKQIEEDINPFIISIWEEEFGRNIKPALKRKTLEEDHANAWKEYCKTNRVEDTFVPDWEADVEFEKDDWIPNIF